MKPDFSRYKGVIRETFQEGNRNLQTKAFSGANEPRAIGALNRQGAPKRKLTLSDPITDHEFFDSLHELTGITGKEPKYHEAPGLHPDFAAIKETGELEYHWIVSMFIDIRRSTRLFAKYKDPYVVANITTTIQRAAIHIAWYFDAYIQRYHGDGLMIYFGGKGVQSREAISNALLAASVFTKFVKEELPDIFLEQGVEDIYTRIGVDVGENDETLWHLAGMQDCSEVTTCSLHTSLAAHMQCMAEPNGVIVGDNVKNWSGLDAGLFNIRKDAKGVEDRYCFTVPEEKYYYTQWNFEWAEHLKRVEATAGDGPGAVVKKAVTAGIPASTGPAASGGLNLPYLRQQASAIKPYSEL